MERVTVAEDETDDEIELEVLRETVMESDVDPLIRHDSDAVRSCEGEIESTRLMDSDMDGLNDNGSVDVPVRLRLTEGEALMEIEREGDGEKVTDRGIVKDVDSGTLLDSDGENEKDLDVELVRDAVTESEELDDAE